MPSSEISPISENSAVDKYKKVMPRKLTLVLEMVDILVKIVDVNSEALFPLQDQSMHQVAVKKDRLTQEVIVMKFMK
jgi:hypothetical protein